MPQHHSIDYIEFSVTDMAAAQVFYAAAFGWSFTNYGPGYAGIKALDGDEEIGGFALVEHVVVGGPLVVLYSDDLEASLDKVQAAGGSVLKPIFEFPGGRRFEFADPSGNRLAVWSKS